MTGRPTIDTDPERMAAWRALDGLARSIDRAIEEAMALADEPLPLPWFRILDALQRDGGRGIVGALSAASSAPMSTVSRQLDQLEAEGWIRRVRGIGTDHRHVVVVLTGEGRRAWRLADTVVRRVLRTQAFPHAQPEQLQAIVDACDDLTPDEGRPD